MGILLGGLGGTLPVAWRQLTAAVVAVFAIAAGAAGFLAPNSRPIQYNRETPQRWTRAGPFRWALWNGCVLGIGAASRIGFWLWYAIPIGALLIGDPITGGILYGMYGLTRGVAAWLILLVAVLRSRSSPLGIWLLRRDELARQLTSAYLLAIGVLTVWLVGM